MFLFLQKHSVEHFCDMTQFIYNIIPLKCYALCPGCTLYSILYRTHQSKTRYCIAQILFHFKNMYDFAKRGAQVHALVPQ